MQDLSLTLLATLRDKNPSTTTMPKLRTIAIMISQQNTNALKGDALNFLEQIIMHLEPVLKWLHRYSVTVYR